jgi:hypothetical protein
VFIGERREKYCAIHREVVRAAQQQAANERFRAKTTVGRKRGRRRK